MGENPTNEKPLAGRSVVLTRALDQAAEWRDAFESLGTRVILFPTIRIAPPEDREPLLDAVRNIARYQWLMLTSGNAVDAFLSAVVDAQVDLLKIPSLSIATVGEATAKKIRDAGLTVSVVPEEFTAEGLAAALREMDDWRGRRVLFPKGDKARAVLPDELRKCGAEVDEVVAYRNVCEEQPEEKIAELMTPPLPDVVTFASPSAAKNFAAILGRERLEILRGRVKFVSIGPTTSKAMRDLNLRVDAEADPHDLGGLVAAVRKIFR